MGTLAATPAPPDPGHDSLGPGGAAKDVDQQDVLVVVDDDTSRMVI